MSVAELKKHRMIVHLMDALSHKDLKFPPEVYESITEYHEEKAEAQGTN